jgi:glutamate synthase domain-containing protein 2/rubredoxin
MAIYKCSVCETEFDETKEGKKWDQLPEDWACHVCESGKSFWRTAGDTPASDLSGGGVEVAADTESVPEKTFDDFEAYMADIHVMAETGQSIIEPMRTRQPTFSWDDILIKGAQLSKVPLNHDQPVNTKTVIGPRAAHPLEIESPVYITHMSFGALSKEAKIALAKGSAAVKTAMCSGEGGILPESFESAYKYIFEYVPNEYSVTEENLKRADAIEIKFGQSAKPGMGGHLPADKVTKEIAEIRGFAQGTDIISPAHFKDILNKDDLKSKVAWLRDASGGKPIGIKFAAGNIEADLEIALHAQPDFITIDGRAGSTGAAPKFVKSAASIPTIFAVYRARKFLDSHGASDISLIATGGLRISPDFAKALALGATAVAVGTVALIAIGCRQYRICNTGKCPMGITTHDPALRKRLEIDEAAKRLENFLRVTKEELKDFARLTGNDDIHKLKIHDLCTTNSEISEHTEIEHV